MEVGQQEEPKSQGNGVASHRGVLSPHVVQYLRGIFGNEFPQPDGGPRAPGKGRAGLSPPHQAEGKVRRHCGAAGGGQEGEEGRCAPG